MDKIKGLNSLSYRLVFYDVDTQNDFMVDPDVHKTKTALYVLGAEHIRTNIKKLTQYAKESGYIIMGSVDKHFDNDPELKKNGGPFPDHCMAGTWGQEKVPETKPLNPIYIKNEKIEKSELEKLISGKKEIFFEKQDYDVFTNKNAETILSHVDFAVVYGVATDYCVKAAVLGMRKLGTEVFLVTDAITGTTAESETKALDEMKAANVYFFTTKEVLEGKVLRYAGVFQ